MRPSGTRSGASGIATRRFGSDVKIVMDDQVVREAHEHLLAVELRVTGKHQKRRRVAADLSVVVTG
jgi:hypothetical protein